MNLDQLKTILKSFRKKKVLVVGDVMVDHYLWGSVERISPEAPVPVVEVSKEEYRLGGAANVALNIKALGAEPFLIGVTGNDSNYSRICHLMKDKQIQSDYLLKDSKRPTTLKSRIIAHSQQVIRIDHESKSDIEDDKVSELVNIFHDLSDNIDVIVLQDYNKGVLTPQVIRFIIEEANKKGIIVAVDPKFKNFFEYKNCTIFKPNLAELQKNTGYPIENDYCMDQAAENILTKLQAAVLIVTRGEKGLTIYQKSKKRHDTPTFAQQIFDVSGAGDTVISTVSLSLSCGVNINQAAEIANHAAGAVCSKIGIQPAYYEDIVDSYIKYNKLCIK